VRLPAPHAGCVSPALASLILNIAIVNLWNRLNVATLTAAGASTTNACGPPVRRGL
jgi:hypothetical protein